MQSWSWFFLACLAACVLLEAGGQVASSEPVPKLILQLGDKDFERRVEAERELLNQGAAGLDLVVRGLQSSNPEIRQRSQRLLGLLQKMAFLEQRDRIREDPWTVGDDLAPAWEVYQSLVGDSWEARDLYVRMIEQETELMMSVAQQPESWPLEFDRRCADLRTFVDRRSNRELDPAAVGALLFLAMHPDNKLNPISGATIGSLLNDQEFGTVVQNAAERRVYRALLSHWVVMSGQSTAVTRLQLAIKFQLPAGVAAAREIIANRNAVGQSRTQLQSAIRFLALYGGRDAIEDLEALLENERVPALPVDLSRRRGGTPGGQADLQTSDVALLGLITITGQNPQDYRFSGPRMDAERRFGSSPEMLGSAEDRRFALDRWNAWRTYHLPKTLTQTPDASEGVPL